MVIKKLAVSALYFQLIFSNVLIKADASETESNNPINWISMYGDTGTAYTSPMSPTRCL